MGRKSKAQLAYEERAKWQADAVEQTEYRAPYTTTADGYNGGADDRLVIGLVKQVIYDKDVTIAELKECRYWQVEDYEAHAKEFIAVSVPASVWTTTATAIVNTGYNKYKVTYEDSDVRGL